MKLANLNLRISWSSIGLFFILSTMAVPLALASPDFQLRTFFIQILIGLLISLITTPFLCSIFLVKEVANWKKLCIWGISLILAGIIRGLAFVLLVDYFGLTDPASFVMRIINSVVTTCFWVTLFSTLIEKARKFRKDYREQISLLMRKMHNVEDTHKQDIEYLENQVDIVNSLAKQTLQSKEIDDAQSSNLRNILLSQINDVLKPMSYRLWKGDPLSSPRIRFRDAISLAIRDLEFSFGKVFASIAILGFINGLSIFGASHSFFRLSIYLSVWSALHYLFRKRKQKRNGLGFNVLYLSLSGFGPVIISEFVNQRFGFDHNFRAAILFMPVLPILICFFAFYELISRERDDLIEKLQDLTGGNLSDLHRLTLKRVELGGYLHNSLQSELLAISMQLDRAREERDIHATKSTVERLHSFLTNVLKSEFSEHELQIDERLKRIQEGWDGISTIRFEFRDLNELDHSNQIKLIQICEEIVTNSVRQGGASIVLIGGEIMDGKFRIYFESNGVFVDDSRNRSDFSWLSYLMEDTWKVKSTDDVVVGEGSFSLN